MAQTVSRAGFVEWLSLHPQVRLIGIAGIPGAGKSTLVEELSRRLPGSAVIPMDGYHLPRRDLDAEGLRRRGSPPTYDARAFRGDLQGLRQRGSGVFPRWNHAVKDPEPGQIHVPAGASRIFVEGNYVLLRAWALQPIFDATAFLDCPVDVAMARVEQRLVECGIVADAGAARRQVSGNDRLNAEVILGDGCRERADFVIGP